MRLPPGGATIKNCYGLVLTDAVRAMGNADQKLDNTSYDSVVLELDAYGN